MANHKPLFIKQSKKFANVSNLIQKANLPQASWSLKWKEFVNTAIVPEFVSVDR